MSTIFSPWPLPAAIYCFSTTSLAGRRARTPGRPHACAPPSSLPPNPPPPLPPLPPQPGSFAPGPPLSPQLSARPGLHPLAPPGQPLAQPLTEGFFSLRPPRPTFLVVFGEFLAFHGVPFFFVVVVERAVCKYRGNSTTEHFVVVLLSIKNTFCFSNKPHNQAF